MVTSENDSQNCDRMSQAGLLWPIGHSVAFLQHPCPCMRATHKTRQRFVLG